MKQTKHLLRPLLMALVMLVGVLAPQEAWAHYVQVGSARYELSEISIEGSPGLTATIELNKDDEIEIYFCGSLETCICPEGNNTLTNTGLSCDINYNWPGSITVADAGEYKLTFSEFEYMEEWVSYDEDDPGRNEVAFAQAHLTIMPLDNHVHSYTEEITSEESQKIYPTCTAPGVYYKSCVCGDVSTSEDDTFEIPARGHNFIADHDRIVSAATCTKNAYYVGVCSRCQEESNVQDYGSKLGHNWHAAADGVHHTCQRCETQEEHTFDKHTESESTFISEATCTSAALYHLSCRYCDAISQDNENIFTVGNPLPHTWGDDDKCTMCHNDFNETGDYMIAQVCINGKECLNFSKEDMGANGKKVHIPEGASISVSLNWNDVYPESDLFIEETSSAVNLSIKETDYTNIYVQNGGDYIINIRRPYFYSEYLEDENRYETHASCILSIEHVHAYTASNDCVHECTICHQEADHDWSNGKCTACNYECTHTVGIYGQWENGVCSICGMECQHNWISDEDGHACTICDLGDAEHDWSNKDGKCAVCGYECPSHDWFDGECETCGILCQHDFRAVDDGVDVYHACRICDVEDNHNFIKKDGKCTECGYVCEHTQKSLNAEPDEHGLYHYICDICDTEDENGVILDGEAFNNPVEFTTSNVIMARTFTQSVGDAVVPATIVLPFSIEAGKLATEEDGVVKGTKFYAFSSLEKNAETGKWEATMDRVKGVVEAYTPYMIVLTEGTTIDLGSNEVTFPATPATFNNTKQGDWTFVATNEEKVWTDADFANGEVYYGYAAGNETTPEGKFVKVGAGASIAPLRAYIMKTPLTRAAGTLPSIISVRLNESAATGIGTLNTETGEFTFEGWYDLQGRRIAEPVKDGIIINNNKKVIVK